MLHDTLFAPFAEFEFMRRALAGGLALALGAPPIGVFLMLRRMSLIGDAMAHAILPGAAIGFLLFGLSLFAMAGFGLIAGFVIAVGAGLIARSTQAEGGCIAGGVLSDFARARRHHVLGQGHQRRSCCTVPARCWRWTIRHCC
jgi:ABC-type Mn2+/Zn2+ transport system permease subunit